MDKVYSLIKISKPIKKGNTLVFKFDLSEKIISLGLYNRQNKEQQRIAETSYSQDGSALKIRPLDIGLKNRGELILGVETTSGLSYFKFPQRRALYLWESYFDFGVSNRSLLNTYAYMNISGKICFINSTKMELDTNVLRIPYIAKMESILMSKVGFTFEFSLSFDEIRFMPNKIRPVLSLVDHEVQNLIAISDYVVEEEAGEFKIKGNLELHEEVFPGNYCFAFEVERGGKIYLLNVYRVRKKLFTYINSYVSDHFIQNYDCELRWFGKEGVIFKVKGSSIEESNISTFGDYLFDKVLSEKEQEKWDVSYQGFEKEWIHRSSYYRF